MFNFVIILSISQFYVSIVVFATSHIIRIAKIIQFRVDVEY